MAIPGKLVNPVEGPVTCAVGGPPAKFAPPRKARRRRTPWQKIMRAAQNGTGLKLDADEILRLGRDRAIETRARYDDDLWHECPEHHTDDLGECPWCPTETP